MRNNYYFIFLFLALGCLAGCSTPIYMYAPAAENIPAATQKGEGTLTTALSVNGLDFQGNYALTDHWGLFAGWYFRNRIKNYTYPINNFNPGTGSIVNDRVKYNRHQFSFGGFYYSPLDSQKKFYFSTLAGYGTGHFSINEHHQIKKENSPNILQIATDTMWYYHAGIQRLILQPSFMYASKNRFLKIIISMRWSFIKHYPVQSDFGQERIKLKENSWYPFTEPAVTFLFRPDGAKWLGCRLQYGLSANNKVPFQYFHFIGNIGLVIYPYKWWKK